MEADERWQINGLKYKISADPNRERSQIDANGVSILGPFNAFNLELNNVAPRILRINLKRGEWRIKETKNGTPQTVTLSPEAMDVLRNRKTSEPTTFVFPGDGNSGHLIEPKKGWKRILERAGIDDLRIHDLRRTLGSWQAKTGASLVTIGKSLNHKNQNTTAIYARLDLDPVRESVNTATSAMMAAAGLKNSAEVVKISSKKA